MPPYEAPHGLGRLQLQLLPDPGAPVAARRALRALPLGGRAEDVLLLVSELVTNAVVHAGSDEPIELTAECGGGSVRIEVRDHGHGFPYTPPREGYGMQMLAAASDRWGIEHDDGACVWFELHA
jgi:anti-sigma regulatory factor (Ser/Thr protein kinase)